MQSKVLACNISGRVCFAKLLPYNSVDKNAPKKKNDFGNERLKRRQGTGDSKDSFWQHTDLEWFSLAPYPVSPADSTSIFLVYLLTVGCGIVFTIKKQHTGEYSVID